jgi:hypothetical protein
MKEHAADPKKYVAGWCIIVLAITTSIVGFVRDNGGALGGGLLIAIFGWGFVAEAKKKKEVPPHLPGLRWYHVALVSAFVAVGVVWLYKTFVR